MEKNFIETLRNSTTFKDGNNTSRYQMYLNANKTMNVNQYLKKHPKFNQVMQKRVMMNITQQQQSQQYNLDLTTQELSYPRHTKWNNRDVSFEDEGSLLSEESPRILSNKHFKQQMHTDKVLKLAQIAQTQYASPRIQMRELPVKNMQSPQAKVNELKYSGLKTNFWLKRMKYHVDRQKEKTTEKSPEPR